MSASDDAGMALAPRLRLLARPGPPLGLIFTAIGSAAALAVGLLRLDRLPVSFCYVKTLSGVPCPTCGSTRALGQLAEADLSGAFAMNPLATLGGLVLLLWGAADLALLPRGRALGLEIRSPLGSWLRIVTILAILANWIYLVAAGR